MITNIRKIIHYDSKKRRNKLDLDDFDEKKFVSLETLQFDDVLPHNPYELRYLEVSNLEDIS